MPSLMVDRDVCLLKDRLRRLKDPHVKAVLLFGSRARREAQGKSDVDLLILHDGCGIHDPIARRKHLYNLVQEPIGSHFDGLAVLDMELRQFLEPKEVNALLLNIYWDALVLLDRTGTLRFFLERAKKMIAKSGLKRVKDAKAYYWVLPEPLKEVKLL